MEKTVLSVKECVRHGWNVFKMRPWFFVATVLIYVAIQFIVGGLQEAAPGITTFLISIIVSTLLYTGFISVYLKAYDNVSAVKLVELWNPKPFLPYLLLSFVLFIIVAAGFVLLIIPGIFLAVALTFSGFVLIEKNVWPIAALKESWKLTRGSRWKLFLLGLALLVLTIIGMLPLMLGLLVVAPVAMLASIHAYRTLSGGTLVVQTDGPVTAESA